jgi:hypothetical protein
MPRDEGGDELTLRHDQLTARPDVLQNSARDRRPNASA